LIAGGGVVADQDPYYLHLLRVSFDGGLPTRLTDGDGDHQWKFSPSKRYLVDRCSRVDLPPTTSIRSLESGEFISVTETADASKLLSSRWTMPQRFVSKGRDGVTDIYGLVVLPAGFDESQTYPVLELIYAGPHKQPTERTENSSSWSASTAWGRRIEARRFMTCVGRISATVGFRIESLG